MLTKEIQAALDDLDEGATYGHSAAFKASCRKNANALRLAIFAAGSKTPEPLTIAVVVEGGIVQGVFCQTWPLPVPMSYVVVDYDTEGADEVMEIKDTRPGHEGETSEATVDGGMVDQAFIDIAAICAELRA